MGFEEEDDVDDAVGEVVDNGDGLAWPLLRTQVERLLRPREPLDDVREPPRERVSEPAAGSGAIVDLRASAVIHRLHALGSDGG
uniref:Uncharacterized protein n=1 Tax=Oryza meridionalis TaxID=40149 RepID=A0A0E0CLJ0_9ORYZ